MKKIDRTGLLLCDLQSKAFELSLEALPCSSEIFIRRFMNSKVAKELDSEYTPGMIITQDDILGRINEQYGTTEYGSVKYTANEIHWIGYIYRYLAYTRGLTSSQIYKKIKPKKLRELYPACHTMDCSAAIDRIIESQNISFDSDIEKQYLIFRRIRKIADTAKSS